MNKITWILLLILSSCYNNKQSKTGQTQKEQTTKVEFDFSFDRLKVLRVDSHSIKNGWLTVNSTCIASEINFNIDATILDVILYRNKKQIQQSKVDSIKLVVNYPVHGGQGMCAFAAVKVFEMSPDYDENSLNYYNKVMDLMYSDTMLYSYANELSMHIYYQFYGDEKMFENSRYLNCYLFFMQVNHELMENAPVKYNYEVWKRIDAYLTKTYKRGPFLKRVKEISEIFSMDLRKGNRV